VELRDLVETRRVAMGPIGVGTTYQQVRSVPSRSEERLEITTYSPPRQLEIRGQLGPFASRLFYAPNTSPEGTRVTDESFKAGVALSAGWDGVSLNAVGLGWFPVW
jgi:hypothetical protein